METITIENWLRERGDTRQYKFAAIRLSQQEKDITRDNILNITDEMETIRKAGLNNITAPRFLELTMRLIRLNKIVFGMTDSSGAI